jgi:hypothetical protein
MYFQKINIPPPKWNLEGIEIPEPQERLYEKHFSNVKDIVPPNLLEKLNTINMEPEYVRLFVWPRNFVGQWHIDGDFNTPRYSCMNWVIKGSGLIQFNSTIIMEAKPGVHRGKASTPTDTVEAETTGHSCAISSGSIHRVVIGEDGRTSISLSYKRRDVLFPVMLEKLASIGLI